MRHILMTTMLLVVGSLFAGGKTEAPKGPVDLTVWYTSYKQTDTVDGKTINPWEESFRMIEEKYPQLKINASYVASDSEAAFRKLEASIQGGTGPDIVLYFDRFIISTWAYNGYLEDITDLVKQDGLKREQFFPAAWDETIYKNRIYGLPLYTDARALFYNKDLFRAKGLDPAKLKTWSDLQRYAIALTEQSTEDPSVYQLLGFDPTEDQSSFYTWAFPAKVKFVGPDGRFIFGDDPNALKTLRAFQWFDTQFDYSKISRSMAGFWRGSASSPFAQQRLAMVITGPWSLRSFRVVKDLHYGILPIPYPADGGEPATWSGGHSLVIPTGSKHVKEAYLVAREFAAGEAGKRFLKIITQIPAYRSAAEELYQDDPEMQTFIDLLATSHTRPPTVAAAKLWSELGDMVNYVLLRQKTPEQALHDAQDAVNKERDALLK